MKMDSEYLINYYADMEPHTIEPVVHHNLDGPNSNGSSFDSSQGKGDFNMDRN